MMSAHLLETSKALKDEIVQIHFAREAASSVHIKHFRYPLYDR